MTRPDAARPSAERLAEIRAILTETVEADGGYCGVTAALRDALTELAALEAERDEAKTGAEAIQQLEYEAAMRDQANDAMAALLAHARDTLDAHSVFLSRPSTTRMSSS